MTRRLDDDPPTAVEYERQAQAEEAARTCFACGHVNAAHRASTEAEQRAHAERDAARKATIRACDGHRGHGETGCGFSTSTWPDVLCPMCGGAMVDAPPEVVAKWYPAERRPVAGWHKRSGSLWLRAGDYLAQVEPGGRWTLWIAPEGVCCWIEKRRGIEKGTAAQLAAEDALAAVEAEIAAVLR